MMRQSFGTFVLVITSLFTILTGWLAATQPRRFAGRLGLCISNAGGLNEVRAQYAGFYLAVSCLCIASLVGGTSRHNVFIALITVFAGLISGRVLSLVLNRGISDYPPTIVALYAIDAVGLLLSVTALKLNA